MIQRESNSPSRRLPICLTSGAILGILLAGSAQAQVANDECDGAIDIFSVPYTNSQDTTAATSNPADPSLSCNGNGAQTDGNTVWYRWTPAEDVSVNISTNGSTEPDGSPLDTAHGVFTGSCGALTEVACVDVGLNDDLIFDATGGETYYIKFGEFLDGVGGGELVVSLEPPPVYPEQLVLESVRDGVSPPISSLVGGPGLAALATRASALTSSGTPVLDTVPMMMRGDGKLTSGYVATAAGSSRNVLAAAGLYQAAAAAGTQTAMSETIDLLQSFDGVENDDNDNLLGGLLYPPDTDGDVGPNHYVQMANLVTQIFDKSGNTVLGPFPGNVFWTGLGGRCENTNSGDVIVLYDEETDRWFVSQFGIATPQYSLCIAISTTGDPTGSYYQHEFDFTGIGLPDYPKYGFVSGAIGLMAHLFNPFQGAGLGAIDKAEAFSANPTTMVFYRLGPSEFGFVVADNDGPVFDNVRPTFFTNNGGSGDMIDVWEIIPDFVTPTDSSIAEVANIPVTPFDSELCNAIRGRCIDQPEGAPRLESITDRLMHRLQLRNFGNDMRAVTNHTVDADGNGKAGVRWYEFRNHKNRGWTLKKEETFSPDGDHRWMGSIAMNAKGETCLGYSISSTTRYPSIGIAARRGTANNMNMGELLAYDGNVDQYVQLGTGARWGDYSAMAIDPVDDSCWYTTEYARPNTRLGELAGWATRIIQVDLRGVGSTGK